MASLATPRTAPTADLLPTGRRARQALALVAVAAPAAQLGWVLTIPGRTTDDMETALGRVAESPGMFEASLLTQTLFGLVAVMSALVIGAAVRPGSPRLGSVATVVAVVGGAVGWSTASAAAVLAGIDIGLSDQQVLDLSAAVDSQASGLLVLATFPLIPLGYLLLGIAGIRAARRGVTPRGAGWVLTASIPLVLIGGATVKPLFVLGWVAVCVGVAGLAFAWARSAGPRP